MLLKRKILLLLIISFFVSLCYSYSNLKKFDRVDKNNLNHLMVRGDLLLIWTEAQSFKNDFFVKKKNFLLSGIEYTRTYLPSRILATYSFFFKTELFSNFEKRIIHIGDKFGFLFFQTFLYYLSIIFYYLNLKKICKNKKVAFYTFLFLALEPTILQWHSSFWTESLYFTLQILLLTILINKKHHYFDLSLLGVILGLMCYQKTVSFFLIIFILLFLIFKKIEKKIYKLITFLSIYLFFILFLALDNYKKTNIIYILPLQTKDAHHVHLLPQIFEKNERKLNYEEYKLNKENNWKKNNDFHEGNFKDIYRYKSYLQSEAIKEILNNKIITLKIYMIKIAHHGLLNPVQTYYWNEYNKSKYKIEYHVSEDKNKWLLFRIVYSILIFAIIIIGIIKALRSSGDVNFYLFILLCVFYNCFMLGWVGNNRYFMPSLIFLSIFFGHGLYCLTNHFRKKNTSNH